MFGAEREQSESFLNFSCFQPFLSFLAQLQDMHAPCRCTGYTWDWLVYMSFIANLGLLIQRHSCHFWRWLIDNKSKRGTIANNSVL